MDRRLSHGPVTGLSVRTAAVERHCGQFEKVQTPCELCGDEVGPAKARGLRSSRPTRCSLAYKLMLASARRLANTMSSSTGKIIFYDLVSTHEGPHPAAIPPNTWKGRLALLHKGVQHDVQYLTFSELRALAPKLGVERPVSEYAPA